MRQPAQTKRHRQLARQTTVRRRRYGVDARLIRWTNVPVLVLLFRECKPAAACSQLDAKRRFEAALAEAGPGMSDILWRVVCAGEGMRDAESALGWPARAGRLVLTLALDRVARFYRIG